MKLMPLALAIIMFAYGTTFALPVPGSSLPNNRLIAVNQNDAVIFNLKSGKYHIPSCSAAKHCTSNCIPLTRGEAKKRGGVPCKLCGAGE